MLSIETLQEITPSVFATSPSPKMSKKYTFVPTIDIVEKFDREGWKVYSAKQIGSGKYGQHEIRLRNGGLPNVGDSLIEAVIKNSHNGLSTFSVTSGLHRLVCSNGLTVPETVADKISVRHTNFDLGVVRQITDQFAAKLPILERSVNKMETTFLDDEQRLDFANKSLEIRWKTGSLPKFDVNTLLSPKREEDLGASVWKTFNVIQEKFIRGGIDYSSNRGSILSSKGLGNFLKINKVNSELWELAETYCEQ
jgi:hypothetical protein